MDNKFEAPKYSFKPGEENRLKEEYFDMNMNPREWIARFGHNIICGDLRMYQYEDQKFREWIYKAFNALTTEELEDLWKEFLTVEEIEEVRKLSEDL